MAHAILPSTDLTPNLNALLTDHGAPVTAGRKKLDADALEGFLREAYRISRDQNAHISRLHGELRNVRQAYLSTARVVGRSVPGQPRVLTDRDREDVDANAKQMIRELNAGIRALDEAEQLRRETESAVIRGKYAGGLSSLSSWASGGVKAAAKSTEHAAAEARARHTDVHRDGVLWFLRQRLELCCRTQQDMMETRLTREMEKSRVFMPPPAVDMFKPAEAAPHTTASHEPQHGLTQEQIQMFEEDNHDMMEHYESKLDKVRTAEKSLVEISELQSLLVNNLATQSAHIEQLVADSLSTTDNVGGGNKQLKQATQRPSAARYTFFAASGLCAFLVMWDLLI
ncbi:hypothetical protein CP532_4128 [Ophiocordyceps camponoti-leonardi (nom. inval.)]|nr:hypothetical protein CP532_4128 [Ophiocordyceps camponoti-leonardi (nom. inval.)]